jgi:hypothetical protein
MFQARREAFENLVQKYKEYIELYKFVNNGEVQGACSFEDFYWRMTYTINYSDKEMNNYSSF